MDNFNDKVQNIISNYTNKGYVVHDLNDLLLIYENRIEEFEDCYQFGLDEYENDLWIRVSLEQVALAASNSTLQERDFIFKLKELDQKLISITVPIENGKSEWWCLNRVLLQAKEIYYNDVWRAHGTKIKQCE